MNSTDMSVDKLPKLDDAYLNEITKFNTTSSHSILLKVTNSLDSIVTTHITPVIDMKGGMSTEYFNGSKGHQGSSTVA